MRVASSAQPERLVEALNRAGIKHGQTVQADLVGVTAVPSGGKVEARFCAMAWRKESVTNVRCLAGVGDGPVSGRVCLRGGYKLRDLAGALRVRNALISTNGKVTLDCSNATVEHLVETPV